MSTQDKINAGFDVRQIPEIVSNKIDIVKNKIETKKSYGNKYMVDRKNLNIRKDHILLLDAIKTKIGCRSYDNVIKHLCDLEAKVDPAFNITYKCKICTEEIKNIPEHINVNKFTHRDLCTDSPCKGFIITNKEIALNSKGFVISNKDKANGTTTKSDKKSEQTDASDEIEEEEETVKEIEATKPRKLDAMDLDNELYND